MAGETPNCSWSTSADSAIAVVEVRSASYPSLRSWVTSWPVESASTSVPTSVRTASQSVQAKRSLPGGVQASARWSSLRWESW